MGMREWCCFKTLNNIKDSIMWSCDFIKYIQYIRWLLVIAIWSYQTINHFTSSHISHLESHRLAIKTMSPALAFYSSLSLFVLCRLGPLLFKQCNCITSRINRMLRLHICFAMHRVTVCCYTPSMYMYVFANLPWPSQYIIAWDGLIVLSSHCWSVWRLPLLGFPLWYLRSLIMSM